MTRALLIPALLLASACATAAPVIAPAAPAMDPAAMTALLDYLQAQNTTGFLVIQNGKTLVEKNWPAPTAPTFAPFVYERTADGALLEDVASQQKSFVSVLVAIAIDKGLIDVDKPVNAYLGAGWSKASPDQEAQIRVINVLNMNSGLDDKFAYQAAPGTLFHYNTPVYAITKRILTAAAKLPLETITHDWLTAPVGMKDTAWRKRPAALSDVGNPTGLVTSPRDIAAFGLMVMHDGVSSSGKRVASAKGIRTMFERSATNPAYGRLWWLNGSDFTMGALSGRKEGQLIPSAPADLVGALGFFERRLYIVPSRKLVVVRTGAGASDKAFDEQLWQRLNKVIG